MAWQCLIRQHAMRRDAGRPSDGMAPLAVLAGGEELGHVRTVILEREPEASTAILRHAVRSTHDPRERFEKGLKFLSATYYQEVPQLRAQAVFAIRPAVAGRRQPHCSRPLHAPFPPVQPDLAPAVPYRGTAIRRSLRRSPALAQCALRPAHPSLQGRLPSIPSGPRSKQILRSNVAEGFRAGRSCVQSFRRSFARRFWFGMLLLWRSKRRRSNSARASHKKRDARVETRASQ